MIQTSALPSSHALFHFLLQISLSFTLPVPTSNPSTGTGHRKISNRPNNPSSATQMTTLETPYKEEFYQKVLKTTAATTACGFFTILSGLTMVVTIFFLVLATPPAIITSPVLVPALIAVSLIVAGLLTSFGLASTAAFIFYWMYGYITGKKPIGARQLDLLFDKLSDTANEIKGRSHHLGYPKYY